MSSPSFPLTTIELVSTERTVPANGSPSSQDYNDDQAERLIDLTAIASFLNGTLIPLMQVLPSLAANAGLEGRAINTDSTDQTPLCFNAKTATPLTIAQSLKYIQSQLGAQQATVTNLNTQVAVLASKLSSTNQNDIALALQSFQDTVNSITAQMIAIQAQVNTLAASGTGGTGTGSGGTGGGDTGSGGSGSSTPLYNLNAYAGNVAFDFSTGLTQKVVLSGPCNISFTNAPVGETVTVIISQDVSGNHPVTFANNISGVVAAGQQPNSSSVFQFVYDGTNYLLVGSPIVNQ